MMNIRQATKSDMEAILHIYSRAREFMKEHGNPTQWDASYPSADMIASDMNRGCHYVCLEQGEVVGTFALLIGAEPTYQVIEQGAWHYDVPYGTIHRVASIGTAKGVAKGCFDFCRTQIDYLRIDTHHDNYPMQGAITQYGFQRCGIIHVDDGSARIAYDYYAHTLPRK